MSPDGWWAGGSQWWASSSADIHSGSEQLKHIASELVALSSELSGCDSGWDLEGRCRAEAYGVAAQMEALAALHSGAGAVCSSWIAKLLKSSECCVCLLRREGHPDVAEQLERAIMQQMQLGGPWQVCRGVYSGHLGMYIRLYRGCDWCADRRRSLCASWQRLQQQTVRRSCCACSGSWLRSWS